MDQCCKTRGCAIKTAGIVADFFSVDTLSLRRLHVLFFIHHRTRRVFLAGMTTNVLGGLINEFHAA